MDFLQMKVFVALFALMAVAHAGVISLLPASTHLVRTPSLDSAVVQSDRVNGAFSYSTIENHAYAPIQTV